MNDTVITVVGNLTAEPELRFTPSGAAVANLTVASTPRTFDKQRNEYVDGETLFMRCTAWRDLAENVAESLTKGDRVVVQGRLVSRSWEDKDTGAKRTAFELQVDEVGPSLRWATAKPVKAARGQGGGPPSGGQQNGWGGAPQGQQRQGEPWAAGPQGRQAPPQRQQGGWGQAPTYDEPPF